MLRALKTWLHSSIQTKFKNTVDMALVREIVDSDFYYERYKDVAESGMDPVIHFVRFGWHEGRDPNPYTHTRFVNRFYSEKCADLDGFVTTVLGSVYHNALMRRCATLDEIRTEDEVLRAEIFNINYNAYVSAQKDLMLQPHLDPIWHLFCDGLLQNRLRAGDFLSAKLVEIDTYPNDYDFLVNQQAPLKTTSFSMLNLSERLKEAEADTTGVVLGVGTLFYNNDMDEITRLMRSIEANFQESSFPCQLHIWDNSPEPIKPAALTELCPGLDIRFSSRPDNPGFSVGHNGMMRECFDEGCTHYLGLNPDGHLLPNSLENLIRFAMMRPAPALIEMEAEPLSHPKWYHPVTGETEWVSGAAFMLDSEAYARTGGFDPEFPMYCEDVDLSFRAYQAGVGLYVAPNAGYYHDTSYRLYTAEPWRKVRSLMGAWYLCHKWGDSIRANFVLREIERQDIGDIAMPQQPAPLPDIDPKITALLTKERFARSRFWGG